MSIVQTLAPFANRAVRPLVVSRRWGRLVDRWMTVVTYTGRRSGRPFSFPVGYRRQGDDVSIAVGLPDQKSWWRNFTGDGGPVQVRLGGVDRAGHATVQREGGGVTVRVRLAPV